MRLRLLCSLSRLASCHHLHLLLLLSGHLGWIGLLLLKQLPGLVGLLLQVRDVGDQLDRVDNTLIVEEHTGDLACGFTVGLLDHAVDSISDLLTPLRWIELLEALGIHRWKHLLLLLLSHHLLLHLSSLVRGHTLQLLLLLLLHGWVHLWWSALSLCILAAATTLSHVLGAGTATTIVVLIATLFATALATLVSTPTLVATLSLLAITAHLATVLHDAILALTGHVVEIFHEVLLNLVETALFTLLVQLLGGHPELHREGASTEWGRLVEPLDRALSTLDVLVEHEVLPVRGLWIEIFALSKFDRNDWANLCK